MRNAEEIFGDINNEDWGEEFDEDESNVPAVVNFFRRKYLFKYVQGLCQSKLLFTKLLNDLLYLEKDIYTFHQRQKQTKITLYFAKIRSINR